MKSVKKFITSILFTKSEREIIWNATQYSKNTYIRRGDVNSASKVQAVMNRIESFFPVNFDPEETFTKEEVDEIITETLKQAEKAGNEVINVVAKKEYKRGFEKGVDSTLFMKEKFDKEETIEEKMKAGISALEELQAKDLLEDDEFVFHLNEIRKTDRQKCQSCAKKKICDKAIALLEEKEVGNEKKEEVSGEMPK